MIGDGIAAVKTIVEALGQSVKYYSVHDLGLTAIIYTQYTGWVAVGTGRVGTITIGEGSYTVTAVVCGVSITIAKSVDDVIPSYGTYAMQLLTFKNGTLRRVQNELTQKANADTWLPLVYMVEVMSSEQDLSPTSNYSDVIDCRLFILEQVNVEDLQTSPEYYAAAITKCEIIAKELLHAFSRSPLIGKLTSRRAWNHINAGTYDSKGGVTNLFPTYTSGVEMRLPLPLVKRCIC